MAPAKPTHVCGKELAEDLSEENQLLRDMFAQTLQAPTLRSIVGQIEINYNLFTVYPL